MQINEVNFIESLHEALAHAAEGGVVEVAVIGDEGEDALAGLVDAPLRPADEFHVVVLQPLGVALAERLAVAHVVIADEFPDPRAFVRAVAGVGRVAEDDEDGFVLFDLEGGVRLVREHAQRAELRGLFLEIFEGVGQEDIDALALLRLVAEALAEERLLVPRGEGEADFEMRDGVRGHEQLEAEEPRQQVLVDVVAPRAELLVALELLADEIEHAIEKRGRAGGGIKDEDAVRGLADFLFALAPGDGDLAAVGEAVLEVEFAFEQKVEAFDDVVHDWLGRVIDAAQFAELRVVGLQEGFVEMDDGIAAPRARAEVAQDAVHAGVIERLNNVVHKAGERLIVERRAGDLLEEMAEKGIGARDELARLLAVELSTRPGGACGEEAVGESLRKHVGKLGADFGLFFGVRLRSEFGEKRGGKGGAPVAQLLRRFIVGESFDDGIAHHVSEVREAQSQLGGGMDGDRALREKALDQHEGAFLFLGIGDDFAAGGKAPERRDAALFQPAFALHIPAEFEVIGEEKIRQVRLVAFDLLGFLDGGEIDSHVLSLDVADGEAVFLPRDDVVGRAALGALRLVGGVDVRECFEQFLQVRAIGMLSGISVAGRTLNGSEIFGYGHREIS